MIRLRHGAAMLQAITAPIISRAVFLAVASYWRDRWVMMQRASSNNDAKAGDDGLPELLAKVALRDKAAFQQLYTQTSAKLFGICLRISNNRAAAEDILQNIYVKVWNSVDQYDPGKGNAAAWLAAIARNSSVDWVRSNTRHNHVSDEFLEQKADDSPLADATLEKMQKRAQIEECLDGLDDTQSAPIRSAFFGGVTYERLAARMDLPVSTMKSRIRRGLVKLKECLEHV